MIAAWQLYLAPPAPARRRLWDDPSFLAACLALSGILLLAALILYYINRWRKLPAPPTLTVNEQLSNFRELYEQGEISQREFERIKARLTPLLREEMAVPESATPTGTAAPGGAAPPSPPTEPAAGSQPPANGKPAEGGTDAPA